MDTKPMTLEEAWAVFGVILEDYSAAEAGADVVEAAVRTPLLGVVDAFEAQLRVSSRIGTHRELDITAPIVRRRIEALGLETGGHPHCV